jgi:hypothetical protein
MSDSSSERSSFHAVLIGINDYSPNRVPGSREKIPDLSGCVNDVIRVKDFLQKRLQVPDSRIKTLTAPLSVGSFCGDRLPTYQSIVDALEQLGQRARPGDLVWIHFSGHGASLRAARPPGSKNLSLYDEALVPCDICDPDSSYLRDFQLEQMIRKLVEKELVVTLVLDSCFSGGAARDMPVDASVAVRGLGSIDEPPRAHELAMAAQMKSVDITKTTRDAKLASGWFSNPQGFVLLAACRAQECAMEYSYDHASRCGAFTHWLLDGLHRVGPKTSCKQLHAQVMARVHSCFEDQTPQLEGEIGRQVFGAGTVPVVHGVTVLEVDEVGGRVLLNTGQAQAIRRGARFAVYPGDAIDLCSEKRRLAVVEVNQHGATESWAELGEEPGGKAIRAGDQAVPIDLGPIRLRRTIGFECDILTNRAAAAAVDQLQKAVEESSTGFLELGDDEGERNVELLVSVNDDRFEVRRATGGPALDLRPALTIDQADAGKRMADRLDHLARFQNIRELANHDSGSPLQGCLEVALHGLSDQFDPADKPQPRPLESPGSTPVIECGKWICLRVKNLGRHTLNLVVLDLGPRWNVVQVYPPPHGGDFHTLESDEELLIPLKVSLPEGYDSGRDIIKVIATVGTASFRWLELPPLNELVPTRDTLTHDPSNPLEALIMALAVEAPPSRDVRADVAASHQWITAELEIMVERKPG